MEVSPIYLLLAVLGTTYVCSLPTDLSNGKNRKLAKWSGPTITEAQTENDGGTLYLNIDEDSNSVDDLAQKVLSAFSSTSDVSEHGLSVNQVKSSHSRLRRQIFGEDNRVNMRTSREAQMYPFSTAVMLSSGCTGTLIGAQHVLTAAHCVHSGKRLLKSARRLKVGE